MFFVSISFFLDFPHSQIFSSCRKNIFFTSLNIRNPHYFSGWKLVFKLIYFSKAFIWCFKVEINNINLIVHGVSVVTRHCHLKFIIFSISESNWVILETTVVCVNLFRFSFFRKVVDFVHDFVGLALWLAELLLLLLITLLQKWGLLYSTYRLLLLYILLFLFLNLNSLKEF